jgi:hypothetical protein
MARYLRVQIFADGRIEALVHGIKGKKCTDYLPVLEELMDAVTIDSDYTAEYYEVEQVQEISVQEAKLGEQ